MNTVWILIALVNNGHWNNFVIPTLEFKTQAACERAIEAFKADADIHSGNARMRCVKIEK